MRAAAELSDGEVWEIARQALGFRRTVRLIGWCVVWRLTKGATLVEAAQGETDRATAYRALADLRRVVAELERRTGGEEAAARARGVDLRAYARRIAALGGQGRSVASRGTVGP